MHTRWFFLFALFLTACIGPLDPNNSEYIEIREVTVGPALARCYGVGEQTCMVVDGLLFYDGIEGFNFEAGYNYRLRIGIYDPYDGEEPPQDAGQYNYRLLEQIEKTRCAFHAHNPICGTNAGKMHANRRLLPAD